ncbi:uncharacterized protein LOC124949884 isoform X2 [Vespa velutina]|uniref:uncharacterized protein LOC124949884 isoform X2 n=1 Tax=Vespa velutina TaxID=202808 RepID=UPI001FB3BE42|nr:uncharacterized protein LOC124949884 isoform X2 [Vespa velutina]
MLPSTSGFELSRRSLVLHPREGGIERVGLEWVTLEEVDESQEGGGATESELELVEGEVEVKVTRAQRRRRARLGGDGTGLLYRANGTGKIDPIYRTRLNPDVEDRKEK